MKRIRKTPNKSVFEVGMVGDWRAGGWVAGFALLSPDRSGLLV